MKTSRKRKLARRTREKRLRTIERLESRQLLTTAALEWANPQLFDDGPETSRGGVPALELSGYSFGTTANNAFPTRAATDTLIQAKEKYSQAYPDRPNPPCNVMWFHSNFGGTRLLDAHGNLTDDAPTSWLRGCHLFKANSNEW